MADGVLIFVEMRDGEPRGSAFELVTAGRPLAESLGGDLSAAVVGDASGGSVESLGLRGVKRVYTALDPSLSSYTSDGYAEALSEVAKQAEPAVVLVASSILGKDLAPALAARLDAGYVSEASSISAGDGEIRATRPVYAGKVQAAVVAKDRPVVVSVRPHTFEAASVEEGAAEEVSVALELEGRIRVSVESVEGSAEKQVDLTEADVVVAGGRGMKGPEHFHLVEELAEALGGVVGSSRAVVDAGWRPHSEQVGQTGKTVSPKLYIACGISGAIQHLAGMTSSRCIVAINKDPEAPIFKVADYGIVGDVFDVLPALIAAVREKKEG